MACLTPCVLIIKKMETLESLYSCKKKTEMKIIDAIINSFVDIRITNKFHLELVWKVLRWTNFRLNQIQLNF